MAQPGAISQEDVLIIQSKDQAMSSITCHVRTFVPSCLMSASHAVKLRLRLALALAAVLAPAWSGYSLNIVGYVNVVVANGYTLLANPLMNSTNDGVTNLLQYAPTGCRAYAWDITNQVFHATAHKTASGWDTNYSLPAGRGFMVYAPLRWTNTFVGNVVQGNITNFIAGNHGYSLVGSIVPVGGPISAMLSNAFPILDGATAHFFRFPSQTYSDGYTCYTNLGWSDPKGIEGTDGPSCNVGEGFVVQNPGPPTNWTGSFVARPAASPVPTMEIKHLHVVSGNATLEWVDPGGGLYDVQFSGDGATWTTIATKQPGNTWTGPLPDPNAGRFQVITAKNERSAK
jgi:hypothetical protein